MNQNTENKNLPKKIGTRHLYGQLNTVVIKSSPEAGRDLRVIWITVVQQFLNLAGSQLLHQLVNVQVVDVIAA